MSDTKKKSDQCSSMPVERNCICVVSDAVNIVPLILFIVSSRLIGDDHSEWTVGSQIDSEIVFFFFFCK